MGWAGAPSSPSWAGMRLPGCSGGNKTSLTPSPAPRGVVYSPQIPHKPWELHQHQTLALTAKSWNPEQNFQGYSCPCQEARNKFLKAF